MVLLRSREAILGAPGRQAYSPLVAEILFEVFESLPRAAPGDAETAERALALGGERPARPRVLDLGCGPGPAATLWLARRIPGARIVAVDLHASFVANAHAKARASGLADRAFAVRADMRALPFAAACLDLVWSEGALYNAGDFASGVRLCRELLRRGGFLVCSEAVWLTADPAADLRAFWQKEYPAISSIETTLGRVRSAGLRVVGHFTLPRQAWWTDFYKPMEARLAELRRRHERDAATLDALGELAAEAELHRRHGDSYGYEMIVARRD
jgi:SAM-dependent methyltransferase